MTVRHILLTVAALAVFGLGVYLFLEVRATPATADVPRRPERPAQVAVTRDTPEPESAPSTVSVPKRTPERVTEPVRPTSTTPPPEAVKPEEVGKLDALMSEANKAYDRGEFDEAQTIAGKALKVDPANTRMLRIMVSASCIDGNSVEAQKWYLKLPAGIDRDQMKTRCDRYGITFNES